MWCHFDRKGGNMFETLKKKSLKSALVGAIILILIGGGLIFFQGPEAFYAVVGYVDFESLTPGDIHSRMMVDVELIENYGCFAEWYEKNTSTNYRKTTDLYYVIYIGDEYAVDFRFMAIKVPYSDKNKMEEMAENTYNGYYSDPVSFSGKIRKMNSEEYELFTEYFVYEDGFTMDQFEEITLPYCIQTQTNKVSDNAIAIIVSLGGLALLTWGIVRIYRAATGSYLKKFRKAIAAEGCTESSVESDFNSAQSFTKNGSIKIGRLFIYDLSGSTPTAIPVSKIMWAHQVTTTHRTNGIKTGTSYSVMIYIEGSGKSSSVSLSVPNEAMSQAILQKINASFPWVVVGFSEEIKRLFNKDRAQFLALRYNTVEHVAVDPSMASFNEYTNTGSTTGQNQ